MMSWLHAYPSLKTSCELCLRWLLKFTNLFRPLSSLWQGSHKIQNKSITYSEEGAENVG